MGSQGLARQVSSVFRRALSNPEPTASSSGASSHAHGITSRRALAPLPSTFLTNNLSRKQSRNMFNLKPKKQKMPKEKCFKVVFVTYTNLPTPYSKDLVICEGLVNITDRDSEEGILDKLKTILDDQKISCIDMKILLYSCKTLDKPCLAPGVCWTYDSLKMNAGQGNVYVMVIGKDDMSTELPAPGMMEETGPSEKDEEDDDFVELGTPVITTRRSRLRLNLTTNRTVSIPAALATIASDSPDHETHSCSISRQRNQVQLPVCQFACATPVSESHVNTENLSPLESPCPLCGLKFPIEALEVHASSCGETSTPERETSTTLERETSPTPEKQKPTFEEALRKWSESMITEEESSPLLIHRQKLMDSLKRSVQRTGFSWLSPVKVTFPGEMGEDFGGPKRELFSLLMKEVARLIGESGSLQHSVEKLENKVYLFAGRCIVWSIMHGGEVCPFLNKGTVDMVLGRETTLLVDDVLDTEAKSHLMQLQKAETVDQIPSDWMIDVGLAQPFKLEKKDELLHLCLKQIVYYRIHAEISQFREGLESFGFLDNVQVYPDGLESILSNQTKEMTFIQFKEMVRANFSPEGSNKRKEEEDAIYAFELFLMDCFEHVGDVSLEQLLNFWTGSSAVPAMRFGKKLEVNFVDGVERLPVAHTCEMSLEIARGITPEAFSKKGTTAVTWGEEFHLP